MKKCNTERCRNKVSDKTSKCQTCKKRQWRKNRPVQAAFAAMKSNAKRRRKKFELTIEQFEAFCIKTDYIKKKGIQRSSYHIDRIDESKGYTADNIQILTNIENIKKYRTNLNSNYNHTTGKMEHYTQTGKTQTGADHFF